MHLTAPAAMYSGFGGNADGLALGGMFCFMRQEEEAAQSSALLEVVRRPCAQRARRRARWRSFYRGLRCAAGAPGLTRMCAEQHTGAGRLHGQLPAAVADMQCSAATEAIVDLTESLQRADEMCTAIAADVVHRSDSAHAAAPDARHAEEPAADSGTYCEGFAADAGMNPVREHMTREPAWRLDEADAMWAWFR